MNQTKKVSAAIGTFVLGIYLMAGTSFAATPPDESAVASDILAAFANRLVTVVTSMATNVWVLSLFALGIAFGIVRRVLSKGASKTSRAVG